MIASKNPLSTLITFSLTFVLSACTSTFTYYTQDPSANQARDYCSNRSEVINHIKLADDVFLGVSAFPDRSTKMIDIAIQLPLLPAKSVQFKDPNLEVDLSDPSQHVSVKIADFRVGVYGGQGKAGHSESVPATGLLEGIGRNTNAGTEPYLQQDLYISDTKFEVLSNQAIITLKIPPLFVNGKYTVIAPQRLFLVTKSICVQPG